MVSPHLLTTTIYVEEIMLSVYPINLLQDKVHARNHPLALITYTTCYRTRYMILAIASYFNEISSDPSNFPCI